MAVRASAIAHDCYRAHWRLTHLDMRDVRHGPETAAMALQELSVLKARIHHGRHRSRLMGHRNLPRADPQPSRRPCRWSLKRPRPSGDACRSASNRHARSGLPIISGSGGRPRTPMPARNAASVQPAVVGVEQPGGFVNMQPGSATDTRNGRFSSQKGRCAGFRTPPSHASSSTSAAPTTAEGLRLGAAVSGTCMVNSPIRFIR